MAVQPPPLPANGWPGPHVPDLPTQAMPEVVLDGQVQEVGVRLGWMKAHTCPCTYAEGTPGSANPNCNTCNGRGVYWDAPLPFTGLITYMHTSAAPDEPGSMTDEQTGATLFGEPVLTVPAGGPQNESTVWLQASRFDAFVEFDAVTRIDTTLVVGQNTILPYQWGVNIEAVTAYATGTASIVPVASGNWTYSNGSLTITGWPEGTAYTVEYMTLPVMIAYRPAGGVPHPRPFAQGRAGVSRRFHLKVLDEWTRARVQGEAPNAGTPPRGPH